MLTIHVHRYVPFWMMENMHLDEGDLLTVRNASLPKGTADPLPRARLA